MYNRGKKPLTQEEILYFLENDVESDIPDLSDEEDYGWIDDSDGPAEIIDTLLEEIDAIEEEGIMEDELNQEHDDNDNEIGLENENVCIEHEASQNLEAEANSNKNKEKPKKNNLMEEFYRTHDLTEKKI